MVQIEAIFGVGVWGGGRGDGPRRITEARDTMVGRDERESTIQDETTRPSKLMYHTVTRNLLGFINPGSCHFLPRFRPGGCCAPIPLTSCNSKTRIKCFSTSSLVLNMYILNPRNSLTSEGKRHRILHLVKSIELLSESENPSPLVSEGFSSELRINTQNKNYGPCAYGDVYA